ncbi:MAG: NADP-dependent oxidoreductase, partial [Burkholderiales bacterium]|nr:NADP-dependent oxidoreductase [Anaerolineae bacterium]
MPTNSDNDTMQAIRVHQYGGPNELKLEQIPCPQPQANEILVRVHAAGVLPMDAAVRGGILPGILPKAFPYTPGTAFAGVVEAVGADVNDFQVRQAICGRAPNGTYAEYVTISTNPPKLDFNRVGYNVAAAIIPLALKPQSLTFDEAATLSGGATTAWNALFEDGDIQAGQRVLIHGAAGGVGLFAVQFAKWKGAQVIGTASAANVEFVRSLGAETIIDYTAMPFDEVVSEVDFVLDTIGGDTLTRSMHITKRGGTIVSVVGEPDQTLAEQLGIRAIKNSF